MYASLARKVINEMQLLGVFSTDSVQELTKSITCTHVVKNFQDGWYLIKCAYFERFQPVNEKSNLKPPNILENGFRLATWHLSRQVELHERARVSGSHTWWS